MLYASVTFMQNSIRRWSYMCLLADMLNTHAKKTTPFGQSDVLKTNSVLILQS